MTTQSEKQARVARSRYAVARAKGAAFDAVVGLWRRRQAAGLQQKEFGEIVGYSPARINRLLRGPANWTLTTLAELVDGLDGEVEIKVYGLDEPLHANFDAYRVWSLEADLADVGARQTTSQEDEDDDAAVSGSLISGNQ